MPIQPARHQLGRKIWASRHGADLQSGTSAAVQPVDHFGISFRYGRRSKDLHCTVVETVATKGAEDASGGLDLCVWQQLVGLKLSKADHILIVGERDKGADWKHPMRRHAPGQTSARPERSRSHWGPLIPARNSTIHRMNLGLIGGPPKSGEACTAFRTMFTFKTTSDRILATSQPREGSPVGSHRNSGLSISGTSRGSIQR